MPLQLLRGFADEVVFCDPLPSLRRRWQELNARLPLGGPRARFVSRDVRLVLRELEQLDVLFYRGDSAGEGGSGVFVLGDSFLPHLLERFPQEGGLIITDGSNSRSGNFKRMTRASGMSKHGWHFKKTVDQPFLHEHGLYIISVARPGRAGEPEVADLSSL